MHVGAGSPSQPCMGTETTIGRRLARQVSLVVAHSSSSNSTKVDTPDGCLELFDRCDMVHGIRYHRHQDIQGHPKFVNRP